MGVDQTRNAHDDPQRPSIRIGTQPMPTGMNKGGKREENAFNSKVTRKGKRKEKYGNKPPYARPFPSLPLALPFLKKWVR